MRPLRDEKKAKDRLVRRASELLAKAAPERREAPPWMKQRVRARLMETERSKRRAWLMQAAAAALVLGLATVAAAGIGRRWIERHLLGREPAAAAPPVTTVVATAGRPREAESVRPVAPVAPPVAPAPMAAPPERNDRNDRSERTNQIDRPSAPASGMHGAGKAGRGNAAAAAHAAKSSAPAASVAPKVEPGAMPMPLPVEDPKAGAPAPPRPTGGTAAKTALDDDEAPVAAAQQRREARAAELVVNAVKARKAGDWVRVGELADEYLRLFPHGALEEHALALAFEAAAARNDAAASRYAATYLQRYPDGRFAEAARRAVARFAR